MNDVHDTGGTYGSGPVEPEEDEPVFHEPWEGRMFGLMVAAGSGLFSRQAIESIEPALLTSRPATTRDGCWRWRWNSNRWSCQRPTLQPMRAN